MRTPKREPQPTDEVNIFKRKVLKESASTSGSATSHKGVLPRNYEHSPYEDETEENHSGSKTYTDLNNVAFNEMAPRYDEDDEFLNNYSSSNSNIAGSAFSVTRSLNEQTTAPIPISSKNPLCFFLYYKMILYRSPIECNERRKHAEIGEVAARCLTRKHRE